MSSARKSHKLRNFILFVVIVVILYNVVSSFFGCNDSKTEEYSSTEFTHKVARNFDEFESYKKKALDIYNEIDSPDDSEATSRNQQVVDDFNEANENYRNGDYAKAQKGYEAVLKEYDNHYGARVNLCLALLQQQKNDEALVQAIVAYAHFYDEHTTIINLQTAAVACGFSLDDVESEYLGTYTIQSYDAETRSLYNYNLLWDRIECTLDTPTKDTLADMNLAYATLWTDLDSLRAQLNDEDCDKLMDYLEAVGKQLGLSAAASVEAVEAPVAA